MNFRDLNLLKTAFNISIKIVFIENFPLSRTLNNYTTMKKFFLEGNFY